MLKQIIKEALGVPDEIERMIDTVLYKIKEIEARPCE